MLGRSKDTVADFLEYDEDSYLAPVEPGPPPELDTLEAKSAAAIEEEHAAVFEPPAPLPAVAPPPLPRIGGRDLVDDYAEIAVETQFGPSAAAFAEGRRTRRFSLSRASFPRPSIPVPPRPSAVAARLSLPMMGVLAVSRRRTVALAALGGTACTVAALAALSVGRGTPDRPDPLAAKATVSAQRVPEARARRLTELTERARSAGREVRREGARRTSPRPPAQRQERRRAPSVPRPPAALAPVRVKAPPVSAPDTRPTPISPTPAAPRSVAEAEFGIEGR